MTIQATCDSCFRTYNVKDQFAGRRIKCPDCGATVQIPSGSASAPAAANDFGGGDFEDHFGDEFAASPERRAPSRTSRPSGGTKSGGSSFAIVAAIIGVVGLFVIAVCGGLVWLGVMAVRNAADQPMALEQDREVERALAGRQVGGTREESGRLSSGDNTLDSGEYVDDYAISANAGDVFVIDMYSDDFDTYLIVLDESEFSDYQVENDDLNIGDPSHSQVVLTAPRTGTFLVLATSFESGETGNYQLSIRQVNADMAGGGPMREETGVLAPDDATLDLGEFVDVYPLNAEQGDLITIDMYSSQFDTYLLITGPNDFSSENDDFEGDTSHSQVQLLVPTTGVYEINATSLAGGETGSYRLTIQER